MRDLSNFNPSKIDKFFDEERINETYACVEEREKPEIRPGLGYFYLTVSYPESTIQDIFATVDKYAQEQGFDFKPSDIRTHIGRYSLETGFKPELTPHMDKSVKFPALTFSVALKTNIDWAVGVNFESWNLDLGDAIIFSGTHQAHWRPIRKFQDGEFLDTLIVQVQDTRQEKTEKENQMIQRRLLNFYNTLFLQEKVVI